jgi:hypothetical protein
MYPILGRRIFGQHRYAVGDILELNLFPAAPKNKRLKALLTRQEVGRRCQVRALGCYSVLVRARGYKILENFYRVRFEGEFRNITVYEKHLIPAVREYDLNFFS